MAITEHLSEAELAEFISDPTKGLGTHLECCDACLQQVARMRETVTGLRSTGSESSDFWIRQQASIRTRIASVPSESSHQLPRLAWAGAAAILALTGLLLSGGQAPKSAPQAAVDPDHELLLAVERVMQSSGPQALEPAEYFVSEINQDVNTNSKSPDRIKELRHAKN